SARPGWDTPNRAGTAASTSGNSRSIAAGRGRRPDPPSGTGHAAAGSVPAGTTGSAPGPAPERPGPAPQPTPPANSIASLSFSASSPRALRVTTGSTAHPEMDAQPPIAPIRDLSLGSIGTLSLWPLGEMES